MADGRRREVERPRGAVLGPLAFLLAAAATGFGMWHALMREDVAPRHLDSTHASIGPPTTGGCTGRLARRHGEAADVLRRVPPQSLEAEESVLGGILLDNTALDRVARARPAGRLLPRGAPPDLPRDARARRAQRAGRPDHAAGSAPRSAASWRTWAARAYLAELAERVPTAANVEHYARSSREKAILRSLITHRHRASPPGYEDSAT